MVACARPALCGPVLGSRPYAGLLSLTGSGGGDYEPEPNPSTTVAGTSYDLFTLPVVPNVLIQRWLVVLVAPYGNQTAIRVDAEVVWLPAKPAAERIPPAAKVVTVTPTYDGPPNPVNERADHAVTITNPATVARIAAAVEALPIAPPSDGFCTPGPQVMVHLTFRASPRGPVIALVNEVECWTIAVTIDGSSMPALSDGINAQRQITPSLGEQVVTIAGLRWPFPPDP